MTAPLPDPPVVVRFTVSLTVALVPSVPVDPDFAQEAYAGAEARRAARAAAIAAQGADPTFGNGTLSAGMEVLSEA